jgi:hypothetical protein
MKTQKQLMIASVLALGLFVGGCREAGMTADRETAEVPAGTQLHVRLDQNIGASVTGDQERWFRSGDTFQGTLEQDLVAHGVTIAPAGTPVKGRFTDNVDVAGREGWTGDTGVTREGDGTITTDREGRITTDRDRDTGVVGRDDRAGTTYDRDRDRIGMELTAIVLHGEDYNIDTHAVPLPPGISAAMSEDRGTNGQTQEQRDRAAQQAAQSLAGQQFVFTLEDNTDLPATGHMRTE